MTIPQDPFGQALASHGAALSVSGQRVARFIDENRATALASSAQELGIRTGTSDATVVRSVQALGFAGMGALKQALVASMERSSTPADAMRRTLEDAGDHAGAAIDAVLDAHAEALALLRTPDSRGRIAAAVARLHPVPRIVVFGIGPSAALAHYASILLARAGRRSRALDATGLMLADQLLDLHADDALLVLAYGKPYSEVAAAFAVARRLGLPVVLVTDSPDNEMARQADAVLVARRGRTDRVALHGTTIIALEALVLGLAAADHQGAMQALDRLNDLRAEVRGTPLGLKT
jgi:DNA-binding MurR/RpiR family transcriptional regulator